MRFDIINELLEAYRSMTRNNNRFITKLNKFVATGDLKYSFTCSDGKYYEGEGFTLEFSELEPNNHMSLSVSVSFDDFTSYTFK